mgnify:CR=1 FL=1
MLRQLVLLKGRRPVSLGYLAPADALRTPEAERFFDQALAGCRKAEAENPGKKFYPASEEMVCPNMKMTTLADVLDALIV